jgi:hypothetical protein
MNITPAQRSALFTLVLCASLPSVVVAAQAQALPGGTYQRTCSQIHWSGTTLVAECRKADGKMTGTGLPDANKCRGDVGNNNGQLQCTYADGKQSPGSSPVPQGQPAPSQGYERPGYGYGQPGYGNAQPGYGNAQPSGPGYGYGSPSGPGYGPPPNPNYPPPPSYAPSYPGYGYGPR